MKRPIFILRLMLAFIGIAMAGHSTAFPADMGTNGKTVGYGPAEQVGTINDQAINEASGMAASRRHENLLWVINDSGNHPFLFAIRPDGKIMARFAIVDAVNVDWEDLAAFSLDRTPYLLIADVGDNLAGRGRCCLYIVEEPEVTGKPEDSNQVLPVKWDIRFRYQGGPRDCEAVAVDVQQKRVLLLSKRNRPPILYEVPLMPSSFGEVVTARAIGSVTTIPPPTAEDLKQKYGFSWSRPTAMDLSVDGSRLIVLTYKHAYAFFRSSGRDWPSVMTEPPVCVPLPHPKTGLLPIREALCLQPETGAMLVTGEEIPAPIFRLLPLSGSEKGEPSEQVSDTDCKN